MCANFYAEINFFSPQIKVLKFIHSKGVLHVDIKPPNIMVKGANVFLSGMNTYHYFLMLTFDFYEQFFQTQAIFFIPFSDFNLCDIKASDDHKHVASMYYGAVAMHFGLPLTESDDLQSLYYVLLTLADVRLPWLGFTSDRDVVMHKLRSQEVEVN